MNLIYINLLPNDIIILIWENYITPISKVWINKENYEKYHYLIFYSIKNYDNYIRDIIRLDYNYVAQFILNEQLQYWIKKKKKIKYQNLIFPTYINYINFLINKHNSSKIKNEIIKNLKQLKYEKIWKENYISTKKKWNGI